MTAEDDAHAEPIEPTDVPVGVDRACIRCSYNLRGLAPSHNCPECGTPVADSLRGLLLCYATPEYVGRIRRGLSLIRFGVLLFIPLVLVNIFVYVPSAPLLTRLLLSIPLALIFVGYWFYTSPDPGYVGDENPRAARRVLRATTAVAAALAMLDPLLRFIGLDPDVIPAARLTSSVTLNPRLMPWLIVIVWIVHYAASMRYTSWVAARLPDPWLRTRAARYAWLLPLVFVLGFPVAAIGPLVSLILYWNTLDAVHKRVVRIEKRLPPPRPEGFF